MESIEPGKTFVRYLPEGTSEQTYLGVVTGILGKEGTELSVSLISRRDSFIVRRDQCVPILPTLIRSGLIHFNAYHPHFGYGVVASEELIDGLLYVELYRDNKYSGLEPIHDVSFCCA